ncbi:hypothetical protein ACXYN8_07220 [Altererythrobacter sp. CAU 1778]
MAAATTTSPVKRRLIGSKLALAIALASGTVLGATALEAPAFAQKKKNDKAPKADYSEAFITAYKPLSDQLGVEGADQAALKAAIPGLVAASSTADDKMATGNFILQVGNKNNDAALQRQGLDMMLDSGKVAAADLARLTAIAGQLAYNAGDYAAARTRMESAIAAGYSENDPEALIAESYFKEGQHAAGLDYLDKAIATRVAAGQPVKIDWIKRGLAIAYTNNQPTYANKYATMYVENQPGAESWNDAIAIALNTNKYEPAEVLDLLRLARATKVLKKPTYMEYIESADARRMPGEVLAIIDEGYASGELDRTDPYVKENRAMAERQIAADKADLPSLERDAMGGSAQLRTVMAAGDAFLNYGQYAKAEALYSKALGMPGVNTATALTRLGITQQAQGKTTEAAATFAKVEGARQAIARLWGVYAAQQAGS